MGKTFADPVAVTGTGALHPETGVDAWAIGTLKFESDIVAAIATGVGVDQESGVRVFGSAGSILVPDPYVCNRDGRSGGKIIINTRKGGAKETSEILVESPVTSYAHEADVAGRAIMAGRQQAEPMTWDDTLGNIRTQDQWRKAIGLVYEAEKPEKYTHTVWRRPLKVRTGNDMAYGKIAHLDKRVARLVMGCDNQDTMVHAATVYDEYFERGGNTFDTAIVYGRAKSEMLGHWMKNRQIRDKVVVIAKGAHTPLCRPEYIEPQLNEQFSWLQTDHADLYMMHRDNPEVPVGEFVDALNKLVHAGRIRTFGGSNWAVQRVAEANAYAKKNKLQGFAVLSNNLSLAEMIAPVWDGCLHVHDAASRKWLADNDVALLAWSSQARGFFVRGRAHPDNKQDAEL
ncbi:MAG: aldo/keto reductase, partial [Kiritimatiellaeota bacterium]|nr:aldo/keto reductase [Kiritimatiellota bacterium]